MVFSLLKYNSFLFSVFIFSSVPAAIYKLTGVAVLNPSILLLLLTIPVLFSIPRVHYSGVFAGFLLMVILVISIVASNPSDDTLKYTIVLIASFAFPACLLAAVPLNLDLVKHHMRSLAFINVALLFYMVIFRKDIYLDPDQMNYMTFGYWLLTSFLVFSFIYIGERKKYSLPMLVLSFCLMLFFGSRFSSISAIISFVLIYYYYRGFSFSLAIGMFVTTISIVLLASHAQTILPIAIKFLEQYNLAPKNLYRINTMLIRSADASASLRVELYNKSLDIISQNPLGVGIYGYYRELLGESIGLFKYPHNVIVQLMLDFGILGFVLITFLFGRLIFLNFSVVPRENGWIFLFLICVITKLFVSGNYLWEPSFWMAFIIGFRNVFDRNVHELKDSRTKQIGI